MEMMEKEKRFRFEESFFLFGVKGKRWKTKKAEESRANLTRYAIE